MGWMEKLCQVYDEAIVSDMTDERTKLVPLGFIRKRVKYHVVLSKDGGFVSADELDKDAQLQEVPSTPQAESRTTADGAPFPLMEQMKYLVYDESNPVRFNLYMEQLAGWCDQPHAPDCLRAVYTYLEGHTLLDDLISQPNLDVKYYKDMETRQGDGDDTKVMVTFSVQREDAGVEDLWLRTDVRESWSRYLAEKLPGEKGFCYVEGRQLPLVEAHPKVEGNAKLISAQDSEFPFQYKGRFADDRSAALISYDTTIRAHNALDWLVSRQGMKRYGMTWLTFCTNGTELKTATDNEGGLHQELLEDEETPVVSTFEAYAGAVRRAALGLGKVLDIHNQDKVNRVVIMGMEAATSGRVSFTYYQECPGNEYVRRLEDWYLDCCWWRYSKVKKTKEIATPRPDAIGAAVLGPDGVNTAKGDPKGGKAQTKLMRLLMGRLLICIAEGRPLPLDTVRSAFNRVCNPLAFTQGKDNKWSRTVWESSVDSACALIHCYQRRGGGQVFSPELDKESQNPDYLYGRLLAVADHLEQRAREEDDRPTNALRLMRQFTYRPFETWPKIHDKLIPSLESLGRGGVVYQILFQQIEGLFKKEDRGHRGGLTFEFLQGYASQRQYLFQRWEPEHKAENGERIPYTLPKGRSELYGCLLAVADMAERSANEEEERQSNALRRMPAFAARPYEGWGRLHDKLIPYLERLGKKGAYYQWLIGSIEAQFSQADRESELPLDGSYLNAYYCMAQTFYQKTKYIPQPEPQGEPDDMVSAIYGRLLGIGDRIERRYLDQKATDIDWRCTNELRLMAALAQTPDAAWKNIRVKLQPYINSLGHRAAKESAQIDGLEAQLEQLGGGDNRPLGSIYLHYYYEERNK